MAPKHVIKTKHVLEHMLLPHERRCSQQAWKSHLKAFVFPLWKNPLHKKAKQWARFASHCHHG